MTATSTHGAVSWFEIATGNVPGAREFYGPLLGWEFVDEESGYTQIATHGDPRQSGGIMATEGRMPSYATTCIRVDDTDATTAAAVAGGASVVAGPMDIGDGMRVAYLIDPQGAMFCVWTPDGAETFAPYGDEPGAVGWFEIGARDVDAALAFYGELFGWTSERSPDPTSDYRLVTTGEDHPLRGAIGSRHEGPYAIFCVAVPDVDDVARKAEMLGGKVAVGPVHPTVGPPNAHLLDRDGSRFGIYTPAQS
jgi:predicted enzyme related to lactoylglutathione lyase